MIERKEGAMQMILRGREKADVAIAGGGLSGITIALWLRRAGLNAVLLEAETPGCGASGRCGGLLSPCTRQLCAQLECKRGPNAVESYMQSRMKALRAVVDLCRRHGLDFGLREIGEGVILSENTEALSCEMNALQRAGVCVRMDAQHHGGTALRFSPVYALDAQEYLRVLAEQAEKSGVRIYEHSRVVHVQNDEMHTESGRVEAPYLVIATGYPIVNTPGWYFVRLEQQPRQVKTFEKTNAIPNALFAADGSFCCYGNTLQTAGKEIHQELWKRCGLHCEWNHKTPPNSGLECITPDGLPYIGAYSAQTPNLFVATGYGGEGILGSMLAAQAITAQVLGLSGDEYRIFSPQRGGLDWRMPARLAGRYLRALPGGFESPRCSHMGCRLRFNRSAGIWDCPCHGSRFDGLGRVLNAPAVRPARLHRHRR